MSFWDEEIRTIYRERDREEMRWKAILKEYAWIWRRWLSMADEHKSLTRKGEATTWHLRIDGCDVRPRAAVAYIGADQCLLFSHMISSVFVDPDFSPRFTVWWGDDDLNRMLPSRTKDGLDEVLNGGVFARQVVRWRSLSAMMYFWCKTVKSHEIHAYRLHCWLEKHETILRGLADED